MPDEALSPIEVVEQWHDRAWGDCDLDVVDQLVDEQLVRHGLNGTAVRTRAELKRDLRQYQRALGRPTITIHARAVEGDLVWTRMTMTGVSMETGDQRVVQRLSIHRVVDGRITEVWTLVANDVEWE